MKKQISLGYSESNGNGFVDGSCHGNGSGNGGGYASGYINGFNSGSCRGNGHGDGYINSSGGSEGRGCAISAPQGANVYREKPTDISDPFSLEWQLRFYSHTQQKLVNWDDIWDECNVEQKQHLLLFLPLRDVND